MASLVVVGLAAVPQLASVAVAGPTTAQPNSPALVPTTSLGVQAAQRAPVTARSSAITATCPAPTSKQQALCVTINSSSQHVAAPRATRQSLQPLPSWCYDDPYTGWWLTRTQACQIKDVTVEVRAVVNSVIVTVGTVRMNVEEYVYTSASLGTWAYQVELDVYLTKDDVAGLTVNGSAECQGKCMLQSESFPFQPLVQGGSASGEAFFTTTVASGTKGTSAPGLWAVFSKPNALQSAIRYQAYTVRCDNVLPGFPSSVGCIVPDYIPANTYRRTGTGSYPELARHIADAQASGLPGAYPNGTPLTRLTDTTLQNANRNKACPTSLPRPTGKSCDEYPYASTYQGASTGGGTLRTFSWCQVTGATATGPVGSSRCMVDATENSVAGGELGPFFNSNRILTQDPFRTAIVN